MRYWVTNSLLFTLFCVSARRFGEQMRPRAALLRFTDRNRGVDSIVTHAAYYF